MKKITRFLFSGILFVQFLFAMMPKQSSAQENFRTILFENGLRLIMKEDHSTSMVASVVSVRGGSSRETINTNGLAHLLEHMLFDGTKTRTRREIKDAFVKLGGYGNAFTRKDFIAYEILMPSDAIYQGMEIQSDMLFNSTLPENELQKEKQVVIEEIHQDYFFISSLFNRIFYQGTSLARPIIGSEKIIQSVKREDLLNYYHRFYIPNNISVIVIGDFDSNRMIQEVKTLFGKIPPGEEIPQKGYRKPIRKWPYREEIVIPSGRTMLEVGFDAPPPDDPDAPAFLLLAEILSEDPYEFSSKLSLPGEISVEYEAYRNMGALIITVPLKKPDEEEKVLETIEKMLENILPISPEQIKQAKLSIRAGEVFDNEKFHHEAREVARWDSLGDFRLREKTLKRVAQLTSDDLRQVIGKWFSDFKPFTVLINPSISQGRMIAADTKILQNKNKLNNGLTVIVRQDPFSSISTLHILVRGRTALEPAGKEGTANLTLLMLQERTETLPEMKPSEIAARIKVTDNPYMPFDDYYFSRDYSTIRFEVINEFFERGIQLLGKMLLNPAFSPEMLKKAKMTVFHSISKENNSTSKIAGNLLYQSLFANHHFGHRILGSKESINAVTLEDINSYFKNAFSAKNINLSIVSPYPISKVMSYVEANFARLPSTSVETAKDFFPTGALKSPKIATRMIDRDQAWIYMGNTFPPLSSQEIPVAMVTNRIIGRRLTEQLREKEGLAYRVNSSLDITADGGIYIASVGTGYIGKAKKAMLAVLKQFMEEEIQPEELLLAAKGCLSHYLQYHQRRINQGYYLGYYEHLGYGYEFDGKLSNLFAKVTSKQVKDLAKKIIDTEGYVLAIAGRTEKKKEGSNVPLKGGQPWPFESKSIAPIDKLIQTYIPYPGTPGYHHGVDMHQPGGTRVLSSTDGIVDFVGHYYRMKIPYAYSIKIKAPDGNLWDYHHVDSESISLKPGDRVLAGQEIARIYNTSNDSSEHIRQMPSHLHLEIRDEQGNYLNPLDYLIESDDKTAPVITDIFFCRQDSDQVITERVGNRILLEGKVDAVTGAYDTIPPSEQIHPIQKIEYSIHDEEKRQAVVPNTILWDFSLLPAGDTYLKKVADIYKLNLEFPDGTKKTTETDHAYYYILTNNKDGEINEKEGFLDTSILPNGPYTFRVRAYDHKKNVSEKSIQIFIKNK